MLEALTHATSTELPTWATADDGHLSALQVTNILLNLSARQPEIEKLFLEYSVGEVRMERRRWLEFIRTEQVGEAALLPVLLAWRAQRRPSFAVTLYRSHWSHPILQMRLSDHVRSPLLRSGPCWTTRAVPRAKRKMP